MNLQKKEKFNVEGTSYDLYSFDIFDTLITRTTANPRGIFAIMQEHLLKDGQYSSIPQYIRNNFFKLRTQHEYYLRRILSKEDIQDVNFNLIYSTFAKNHYLNETCENLLKSLEIETEKKNLLPISENITKLKTIVNSNKRVILISDMYLPKEVIQDILIKFDKIFENIPIYLSSTYGKMKKFSKLYEIVKNEENIQYNRWCHFGDNRVSDVNIPKQLGIHSIKYNYISLKDYELKILKQFESNAFIQLAIGASKNARLFECQRNPKRELGASFVSGLFVPYIEWLIEQVNRMGLTRLYFLARDGYVLQRMFDSIAKERGLNIKTSYIYGSREAWRIPSITSEDGSIDWIFIQYRNSLTIPLIAELMHITKDELLKYLPTKFKNSTNILSKKEVSEIEPILLNNNNLRKIISEKNETIRNLVINYFKQEIDYSDDKFAVVDLQGSGYTLSCLESIVKKVYNKPIIGFFMRGNMLQSLSREKSNSYMFPNDNYTHFVTEVFARAPHGQTIGYEYKDNKIEPILDDLEGEALIKWDFNSLVDGIVDFCKYYKCSMQNNSVDYNLDLYCQFYNYLFTCEDKEFANLLGSIPFILLSKVEIVTEFAEKCTTWNALLNFLKGKRSKGLMDNISFVRSSKKAQKLIKMQNKYGSLRKLLINLYVNLRTKEAYVRLFGFKIGLNSLLR